MLRNLELMLPVVVGVWTGDARCSSAVLAPSSTSDWSVPRAFAEPDSPVCVSGMSAGGLAEGGRGRDGFMVSAGGGEMTDEDIVEMRLGRW
jgi:hypothetical protein